MRKVSVCANIFYQYEVEIPDNVKDLPCYCDAVDPVYFNICKEFTKKGIDYDGNLVSICDAETGEELWAE